MVDDKSRLEQERGVRNVERLGFHGVVSGRETWGGLFSFLSGLKFLMREFGK